jgi:hypothetical protein
VRDGVTLVRRGDIGALFHCERRQPGITAGNRCWAVPPGPPPVLRGNAPGLLGFALALGNWAGLFAMLVLPAAAFAYRIKVEEAALLSTLGEPYARYMRRTWRLIPYLI